MSLALRVMSGSRAGATLTFDQDVVSVGRHAISDLKFDPQSDLDVSTRHAELRAKDGGWVVVDEGSTNGTFVNRVRVEGEHRLSDGDVISFGANGPRVEVSSGAGQAPLTTRLSAAHASAAAPPPMNTELRVAHAVKAQTRSMKRTFGMIMGLVVAIGGSAFVWTQKKSNAHEAELNVLIARADSTTAALARTIAAMRPADSAITRELQDELERRKKELAAARAMMAGGTATTSSVEDFAKRVGPSSSGQMDVSRVSDQNDAAVAFVVSDLDGAPTGGTAFGISPAGLLLTNKHVVHTEAGAPARRIAVMYANTNQWVPARIVRVSETDDLALIQLDVPGSSRPVVHGVSRAGAIARVGAPVVSIGYPLSNDTPMEGEGLHITARTTTIPGTVSKRLDDVLQIDSFSAHGASGSPLFDAEGNVVGVIYGGARDSGGRIVYAVPAQRISAFIGSEASGIIR